MKTVSLKCKSCGGVLDVDEDREILCCPYCGSKEIFEESDSVKETRIREKTRKDISMAEMRHEENLEKIKAQMEENSDRSENITTAIVLGSVFIFILLIVLLTT